MRHNESRWLRAASLCAIAFFGMCSVACATSGERGSRSDDENDDDAVEVTGGASGPGTSADTDGDGLTDVEEAKLGTDPAKTDTDGDGFSDDAEVAGNVDPLSAKDKPYQGAWGIDSCRFDVVSTGNNVGDIAENFALKDQFDETVRLHDFCGKLVVLLEIYWWCEPCRDTAQEMQTYYEKYKDKGFLPIGLVIEGLSKETPTQAQLQVFADTAGVTYPFLLDGGGGIVKRYPDDMMGFKHIFIGPGAKILDDIDYVTEQDITGRLP